jgi:iron complex outermembrane receptor protein
MPERSWLSGLSALIPPVALAALACSVAPIALRTAAAQTPPVQTAETQQTQTAAAAPAAGVEDIVVTAERRSTNLQTTPLAITAISAGALDKSNINQLADTNGLVPGLEITKSSGFETIVTIRGVGSETPENAPITEPGVALFVDGVYIANTISLDQTLFDIDHIEVLRGPQGALYGQSATGGAINLVTKQPELHDLGGSADFSVGNYNLTRERAELNIPIDDTIAVRASVQKYDHDGFTRDTFFPNYDLDDAHDVSGKAALLWKPTSNFSATVTGQWYSADQNGAAQKNVLDPNSDPWTLTQDYPSKFNLDTQLYHVNLQWDLPWFSISSVTAYQQLDHRQQEDSSRSAYELIGAYDDVAAWNTTLRNYSEELDLLSAPDSPVKWIGGIFLLDQRSTQFVAEFEGTNPNPNTTVPADIATNPPSNLAYGNTTIVERKSYSPFLQATYPILDQWRVTLGGRYNYDSYHLFSNNFSEFAIDNVSHSYNDREPTWRIETDYDLTADNMLYASVSRGYKPGGVNGIGGAVVVPNTFVPETNTAYEIGSKNRLLGNKLRLNLAGFFYDYKNMQYIETDPVPFDGGIANIPSVHIWGGEAEASYLALDDRLRINANLAVEQGAVQGVYRTIDSTVQKTIENSNPACAFGGAYYNPACWNAVIAGATNIGGNTPPKMPDVAGSIDISYAEPIPTGTLTPRVQFVYRGAFQDRIFAVQGLDNVGAYGLWNVNLEYVPDSSNFTVNFAVTNLTNVAGVVSRYTDPYGTGTTSQQYIPPRQFIGTVAYTF